MKEHLDIYYCEQDSERPSENKNENTDIISNFDIVCLHDTHTSNDEDIDASVVEGGDNNKIDIQIDTVASGIDSDIDEGNMVYNDLGLPFINTDRLPEFLNRLYDNDKYEAPIIGRIEDVKVNSIDYIVYVDAINECIRKILSDDSSELSKYNSVWELVGESELELFKTLTIEDIEEITNYSNRVDGNPELTACNTGFDEALLFMFKNWFVDEVIIDFNHVTKVKNGIQICQLLDKFLEIEHNKYTVVFHLNPKAVKERKNVTTERVMHYCINLMWSAIFGFVIEAVKTRKMQEYYSSLTDGKKFNEDDCLLTKDELITIAKETLCIINPIVSKLMFETVRPLNSDNYRFIQEMKKLHCDDKHIIQKITTNKVSYRYAPFHDEIESTITKIMREQVKETFYEPSKKIDVRGDSDGSRCIKYVVKFNKGKLHISCTLVGFNVLYYMTGYHAIPNYDLMSDVDSLKHIELATLYVILTHSKEFSNLLNPMQVKQDIKAGKIKLIPHCDIEDIKEANDKETKPKKRGIQPIPFSQCGIPLTQEQRERQEWEEKQQYKLYTADEMLIAVNRALKKSFRNIETDDYFRIASQLIEKFQLKRNVPKDIITVLKFVELDEDELQQKLKQIEPHKRKKIQSMVEHVKSNYSTPEPILHNLINYLYLEGFRK